MNIIKRIRGAVQLGYVVMVVFYLLMHPGVLIHTQVVEATTIEDSANEINFFNLHNQFSRNRAHIFTQRHKPPVRSECHLGHCI